MRLTDSLGKACLRLRYGDEMDVIGHQAPREILDAESSALFRKHVDVGLTIIFGEENVHPVDATLSDVMWDSGNDNSRYVGHAMSLA